MKRDRFESIVAAAEEALWKAVAEACPETTTGDMDPGEADRFHKAAFRAIEHWVFRNAIKLPPDGTRVRLTEEIERYPHFIVRAGMLGTVRRSGGVFEVRLDETVPGAEEWDNCIVWSEPEDLFDVPDEIEVVTEPPIVVVDPPRIIGVGMSRLEMAQAYHAACLAIGMGNERPRDMDEAGLIAVRDKLRHVLDSDGWPDA